MTDSDKKLDNYVRSLLMTHVPRRGRPPNGFQKALQYSGEVEELIRLGTKPWKAVQEIAARNHKTPEHISACLKKIADTNPYEYLWEYDPVDFDRPRPEDESEQGE